jgi:hypothetical protein
MRATPRHGSGREIDRERQLLLRCVRVAIGTDARVAARDAEAVDWTRLVDLALQHGVLPLLQRGLARSAIAAPAASGARMRSLVRGITERNLRLTAELREVLAALAEAGLPAVPLKGPALAALLYGDVTVRQFNDIDVLVHPLDAPRARAVLARLGYAFGEPTEAASLGVRKVDYGTVTLDLHWQFAESRYSFPMDMGFWDRLQRQPTGVVAGWRPQTEDYLLFLCGHPATHCWSRLGWIADIARFIHVHRETLDWNAALARARQVGGLRVLLVGVELASAFTGVAIPSVVRELAAADRRALSVASELRERLLAPASEAPHLTGTYRFVEGGWLYMRSRERIRDKASSAAFLVRVARAVPAFTPNENDRASIPLPPALGFLYYVVRPIRLLTKYGSAFLSWLRRERAAKRQRTFGVPSPGAYRGGNAT